MSISLEAIQEDIKNLRSNTDERIQGEIDKLQKQLREIALKNDKPTNTQRFTVAISFVALLFSIVTTVLSYYTTLETTLAQHKHNLRIELRATLQRLVGLERENAEVINKYRSDPSHLNAISGALNQENLLLTKQAKDIIDFLQEGSASDYTTIAKALYASRNSQQAEIYFNRAVAVAALLDDEDSALRGLATLKIMRGDSKEAFSYLQVALDIVERKYNSYDKVSKCVSKFTTEITWASMEINSNHNPDGALPHFDKAQQCIDIMPISMAEIYKERLQSEKNKAFRPASGVPAPSPAVPGGAPVPVSQPLPH